MPGLTSVCPIDVIGDATLMMVGVPVVDPAKTVFIGEARTPPDAAVGVGSCGSEIKHLKVQQRQIFKPF